MWWADAQAPPSSYAGNGNGAGADGAILIGFADGVALLAARRDGRMSLRKSQRIGWTLGATGLKPLAKGYLLNTQPLLSVHSRPTRRCVPAAQEFLVDAFVARAAVSCGEMGADHKAVMIHLLLVRGRRVAVQAVHALLCVRGHLVLMHHRKLKTRMALRALTRSANEIGGGLLGFNVGASPVDEKG